MKYVFQDLRRAKRTKVLIKFKSVYFRMMTTLEDMVILKVNLIFAELLKVFNNVVIFHLHIRLKVHF